MSESEGVSTQVRTLAWKTASFLVFAALGIVCTMVVMR